MNESIRFDDVKVLQQLWSKFSSQLFQEIKSLRDARSKNEIQKKKLETISKIVKKCENDIDFLLKHTNVFLELDPSFKDKLDAIVMFQEIGALDNPAVPMLVDQILKSDVVSNISADIEKLNADIDSINDKIFRIEELRSGRSFDREYIEKYCFKFGYDSLTYRKLMLYPIVKAKKDKKLPKTEEKETKKVSVESVIEDIKKSSEKKEEEPILVTDVKPVKKEKFNSTLSHIPDDDYERMIPTNGKKNRTTQEYRGLVTEFEKIKNKYRTIINEYKKYLGHFNDDDISRFVDFCYDFEKEFKGEELMSYDEYTSKKIIVTVAELVKLTTEINAEKNVGYANVNSELVTNLSGDISLYQKLADELLVLHDSGSFKFKSIFAEDERLRKEQESKDAEVALEEKKKHEAIIEREKNKNRYNELRNRYNELVNKYTGLYNKYKTIIYNMKPEEKSIYEKFANIAEDDLINIITTTFGTNTEEIKTKLLAFRTFDIKKEIDLESEIVVDDNYDKSSVDEFELSIDELEDLSKLLELADSKLVIESEIEEVVDSPSSVYFFVDPNGELIMGDKQDELLPIYARMSRFTEVSNMIKKKPLILKDITALGRKPIIQRVGNSVISFVPIENESGKCIFIIDSAMIYDGSYSGIHKNTIKVVSQHSEELKKQIGLIETLDPEFLDVQASVREQLKQYLPNTKGEN